MRGVDPRRCSDLAELASFDTKHQLAEENHLGELCAVIQLHCANILVHFFDRRELDVAACRAMHVGGLRNQAQVGRLLQDWQKGEHQVRLRKMVDLHVRVQAILALVVYTDTKAGVADQGVESV